jgi:hypothetical protein
MGLKGFVKGVASGTVDLVTAVPRLIIESPTLVPALYHAVVNYDQTWNEIKRQTAVRYEHLLTAPPEEWGEFVGEVTVGVFSIIIAPAAPATIGKLTRNTVQFVKAAERGIALRAAETAAETTFGTGKITTETAETLLELQGSVSTIQESVVGAKRVIDSAAFVFGHAKDKC